MSAMGADDSLPDDVTTLQAMLRAERAARLAAEAEAQAGSLLIEKLKLTIKKLRHEQFGQSSERGALLDQLELQLADLEENAAQAETATQMAAEKIAVPSFERRKPARRPLPEHLPRERIVYPVPATCPCCGDSRLRKIGEDVTEMLELVPRQWKVIQHVRERLVCRACEVITQPPAPSHPIARGRAGPKLLAHVLFAKYGLHLPLNRQSDVYQREGIDLDVSTLADWVGASAATLMPLVDAIRRHVFAAERIHADDTTVPVLAKGKTRTGRLWTYVRDDRPFAGPDPPAAVFFYSPDRGGAHPEQHLAGYAGLMQADAYAGFGRLYEANRKGGPIIEAACWAHGRRKFFDLARLTKAPIAAEAVKRVDVLFAIEREINGLTAQERLRVRQERSRPLIVELEAWLRQQRAKLSRNNDTTKAINYCLSRWGAFSRFLDDGRLCMSTDGVEKSLPSVRSNFFWFFLPGSHHAFVGLLDACDITSFPFADFLNPIVPARASLAVGTGSPSLQSHLPEFHRRERWPRVSVVLPGRQDVPDHDCELARRRDGCDPGPVLFLRAVEECSQRTRRRLG
ncbi:transposase [Bradyrhizobium yuanmingense]|uniref:Transposase n=1 Tax=Bradyrhizobium yuanmingense TaxID=108015 RepID=A0ABV4GN14_9BRAD